MLSVLIKSTLQRHLDVEYPEHVFLEKLKKHYVDSPSYLEPCDKGENSMYSQLSLSQTQKGPAPSCSKRR